MITGDKWNFWKFLIKYKAQSGLVFIKTYVDIHFLYTVDTINIKILRHLKMGIPFYDKLNNKFIVCAEQFCIYTIDEFFFIWNMNLMNSKNNPWVKTQASEKHHDAFFSHYYSVSDKLLYTNIIFVVWLYITDNFLSLCSQIAVHMVLKVFCSLSNSFGKILILWYICKQILNACK